MAGASGRGMLWAVVAAVGVCCAVELFVLGGLGLAIGGAATQIGWVVAAGALLLLATFVFLRRRR